MTDEPTILAPCGHTSTLDATYVTRDHYRCPQCGLRWHYTEDPPEILCTGFIMPGRRRLVIEQGFIGSAIGTACPS